MRVRALDRHPINGKLNELWDKMVELGITISILPYEEILVEYRDADGKVQEWTMCDNEDSRAVSLFPPEMEYKLVREIKTEKELAEERARDEEREQQKREAEERRLREDEERKRALEQQRRERDLRELKRLMDRYPEEVRDVDTVSAK